MLAKFISGSSIAGFSALIGSLARVGFPTDIGRPSIDSRAFSGSAISGAPWDFSKPLGVPRPSDDIE